MYDDDDDMDFGFIGIEEKRRKLLKAEMFEKPKKKEGQKSMTLNTLTINRVDKPEKRDR